VFLEEGPWPHDAYCDARDRDKLRHKPLFLDHCALRPRILSMGPAPQNVESCPPGHIEGVPLEGQPLEGEMPIPPTPAEDQLDAPPVLGEPVTDQQPASPPPAQEASIRTIPDEYDPLPSGDQHAEAPADVVQGAEFLAPYEVHSPEATPIAP
jgi:hypothetical protein